MAPIKIFLSVGRTSTDQQEKFVETIEGFLRSQNVEPLTVGRSYFSSKQPLVAIAELMKECTGSMILAYERVYITEGIDRRGNPKESTFKEAKLPTVWNQIEATMAYTLGHPLLVMVEDGLRSEGLLERGYDWFVKSFDLTSPILEDPEFLGVFKDWQQRLQSSQVESGQQSESKEIPKIATLVGDQSQNQGQNQNEAPITREYLSKLRQILDESIGLDDLRLICFDMAEDYENLQGDSKAIKIMNLLLKLERAKQIPKLVTVGRRIRNDIPW